MGGSKFKQSLKKSECRDICVKEAALRVSDREVVGDINHVPGILNFASAEGRWWFDWGGGGVWRCGGGGGLVL